MGAIDLREVPRALRFLRWALPVQRVNIRGKPPIPPEPGKGALMQTAGLRAVESITSCFLCCISDG